MVEGNDVIPLAVHHKQGTQQLADPPGASGFCLWFLLRKNMEEQQPAGSKHVTFYSEGLEFLYVSMNTIWKSTSSVILKK